MTEDYAEVSAQHSAGALDRIPEVPVPDRREEIQRRLDEARADFLGRRVREAWVEWATRQPSPKPSHLVGWDDLDEGNREVDRLIGQALAAEGQEAALIEERQRHEALLDVANEYFDLVGEVLTKFHDFDHETHLVRTLPLPMKRWQGWRRTANDLAERLERARAALGQETEAEDA